MAILISAHTLNSRFTQLIISVLGLLGAIWLFTSALGHRGTLSTTFGRASRFSSALPPARANGNHPIDHLIREAEKQTRELLHKEPRSLNEAARDYRKRRGRQPPPLFDQWYQFAQQHDALIAEDYFDRIYDDLRVFWGASPNVLRNHANSYENKIQVREQTVTTKTWDDEPREQMEHWREMLEEIVARDFHIPDVDIPINIIDEPRIIAKWEDVREHMMREAEGRAVVPADQVIGEYQRLAALDKLHPGQIDPIWIDQLPYWNLITPGCDPESPARKSYLDDHDYTHSPVYDDGYPKGSHYGFVKNWTLSKSLCENPNLQSLSGTFIEPLTVSTTSKLIPMFGQSKLSVNNEILLPSPFYFSDDYIFARGEPKAATWDEKENKVYWRGAGTGGRNREWNWVHFHRHRFVSMSNATSVRSASNGEFQPNFKLPDPKYYDMGVLKGWGTNNDTLGDWVEQWSDVGLTNLQCFPDDNPPFCPHTDPWFTVVPDGEGYDNQWRHKYLPDLDNNIFSARLKMYLDSTSLPIKATVYSEWHDSRLVPWKHFVPMHNSFMDYLPIMDYFLGNPAAGIEGHDDVGKSIALMGQEWVKRALRKEDMLVYMYRVVLEFARLCHDSRYKMGWADDLL